ncbi:hypothetical protein BP5796_05717 [Coleophoma crateriformis]|uniref:DUF6594 domain-containing protein n=1 Tax=Coleophoma crateriformis TaxID=565419 RepID=A0A3D8RV34_9HELO|nr:hypothetical protein BP5796_05717 [Coleophoma crateriformis]
MDIYDQAEQGCSSGGRVASTIAIPLKVKTLPLSREDSDVTLVEPIQAPYSFVSPKVPTSGSSWYQRWVARLSRILSRFRKSTIVPKENLDQYREGYERFIRKACEDFPLGLPRIAAFQNSCDSFAIFKKFSREHIRILLNYEIEITKLSARLHDSDERDKAGGQKTEYRLRSRWRHKDLDADKNELEQKLEQKLLSYGAIFESYRRFENLDPTPKRDHDSVFKWFWKYKPLEPGKDGDNFLFDPNDFVSVTTPKMNRFEVLIRNCVLASPNSWLKASNIRLFLR